MKREGQVEERGIAEGRYLGTHTMECYSVMKGGIWVSPNEVDEPKAYCTEWSKSEIER